MLVLMAPLTARADEIFMSDGRGCMIYDPSPKPNETVTWSGQCVDGYASGEGVVQWLQNGAPGSRVEGTFVRGRLEGHGRVSAPDGFLRYEGDFVAGEESGSGTLAWRNGDRYAGDFLHGDLTGKGVLTRANGERYEGDFVKGAWWGVGTYTHPGGERYSGEWVNNKRQGRGEIVWGTGAHYSGLFVDDKPSDPSLIQRESFAITRTVTGSAIAQSSVWNIEVPVDKSYAEMTPQERRRIKSHYESMSEDDVPPYPLHGIRQIYDAAVKVQTRLRMTGLLSLAVTVNPKGEPVSVDVIKSPDTVVAKAMAQVLMVQKYSPASCAGAPCQMQFPFRIDFGSPPHTAPVVDNAFAHDGTPLHPFGYATPEGLAALSTSCLPSYPAASRRLGEEGDVILQVWIAADGTASQVSVAMGSGYERLDSVTAQCFERARPTFVPLMVDGQPADAWQLVRYRWQLNAYPR